ncbi:MAG: hypothetical protein H7Z37_10315 [Pyrinomonadaceae bacterium]|nr:hypothetical protein [Pyrinomonadaceae bacterium]
MSKKKKRERQNNVDDANRSKPASSEKPQNVVVETSQSSVNESKTSQSVPVSTKPRSMTLIYLSIVATSLVVILACAYFLSSRKKSEQIPPKSFGYVTSCQPAPQFLRSVGFGATSVLSTSERNKPGLWIVENPQNPNTRKYQHPSWKSAGYLAPIQRDKLGNVYVAPAPNINVLENPIEKQNTIYQVDGNSQQMSAFVDLPKNFAATVENPYGALAMAYDCETNSLYASSVYGSSREREVGGIYKVDATTKTVTAILDNTDVFGLSVFNTQKTKRLYYGLGRKSEIWSLPLNEKGERSGESRLEFSMEKLGTRGSDKARRIAFTPNGEMLISGVEFDFNLIAPTEKPETLYRFRYDKLKDIWEFVAEPPQIVN